MEEIILLHKLDVKDLFNGCNTNIIFNLKEYFNVDYKHTINLDIPPESKHGTGIHMKLGINGINIPLVVILLQNNKKNLKNIKGAERLIWEIDEDGDLIYTIDIEDLPKKKTLYPYSYKLTYIDDSPLTITILNKPNKLDVIEVNSGDFLNAGKSHPEHKFYLRFV